MFWEKHFLTGRTGYLDLFQRIHKSHTVTSMQEWFTVAAIDLPLQVVAQESL